MIIKYKIKRDKKSKNNRMFVWIQKRADFESDIQQVLSYFEKDITIKVLRRFHKYYKIASNKPIIMISLISTLNEIIPELFFNNEDITSVEEEINLLSIKDL
jgi:hypothetical protein